MLSEEIEMANWKDIKAVNETSFFEGAEYMDIKNIINRPIEIEEVKMFENDKGAGAAVLCNDGEKTFYICTHSIGLVKTFGSDEFMTAVEGEPVQATVKEGKSRKSGKYFYYLE